MRTNKSIFTLIATVLFLNGYGQTIDIIDTADIIYTAKINFLTFNNVSLSKRFMDGFLKYAPEYAFVKSDGFDNSLFFLK